MVYNPDRHHRRSIRLRGFDYSCAGAYFLTICTHDRECLFGEVVGGDMRVNDLGGIVDSTWNALPEHYSHVRLDSLTIMPNHVHAILILAADAAVEAGVSVAARRGIGEIARAFKTFSARAINASRLSPGRAVWQRSYYEHRIRSDETLMRIRQYILDNPSQWSADPDNPSLRGLAPGRVPTRRR